MVPTVSAIAGAFCREIGAKDKKKMSFHAYIFAIIQ